MRVKFSILLVATAFVLCVSGALNDQDEIVTCTTSATEVRAGFSPSKLFDFDNYKTVFHKTYSGVVEELVRAKYFLSRAFRAFISAIKYKYRQSPYYLAVNHMSDWTPEEFDKSQNKLLAEVIKDRLSGSQVENRTQSQSEREEDLPELLPENVEEAEKELSRMADGFSESSSPQTRDGEVRDLPMEKLFDTGADAELDPSAASKLTNRVPSNNRDYEPLELPSFGLRDQSEGVEWWLLKKKEKVVPTLELTNSVNEALSDIQKAINYKVREFKDALKKRDEVFVDLRRTGCLTMPREQGTCGSCWAFAATAIFEFLYCKKTGKLVPFSEQYMIDCAKPYFEGARGCMGGYETGAADFVKNFGLELRAHYPYNMRENQCPYEESMDLKSTGYIRFEFEHGVEIKIELWPEYIKIAPLWIIIYWSPSFNEYGGGVFGQGCQKKDSPHAVAVVGHGREDGQEYWLIRNSHSTSWGEGGYGKLAKTAGCIPERSGYAFATKDGSNITPKIAINQQNMKYKVRNRME